MTNSIKIIIAKSLKVTIALALVLSAFSFEESVTPDSGTTQIENPKDKPKP